MIPFMRRAAVPSCGCDLPQCVFSHDFTFSEKAVNPSSANTERLGESLASLQAISRAVSQLKLLHLDPLVIAFVV